jgi:predicted dehydrogenase
VREARRMIADGHLGALRKLVVEYSQGWLAQPIERGGANKQAQWRADPKRAGEGGCIGDIGVHAFNLAEFVSGRRVVRICADLNSMVAGRALDDDCNILLRLDNGAAGVLIASQVAIGERNGLRLRVYGDKAALDWSQESPNELIVNHADGRCEIRHAGSAMLSVDALCVTRLPMGHPEGYLEAFANIYGDFAKLLKGTGDAKLVPGAEEGLRGMALIATAVRSSIAGGGWTPLIV